ncbi:MAG TPA: PQQ-dependent sugar dehydrogenase [Verrucomicrobiae bacterium]|nr:PQQ-dependent sugar dehydrogenase [Verrucomicrobiae bacterium]
MRKTQRCVLLVLNFLVLFAIGAVAQSFPQIKLQQIFLNLQVKSPVWMCQPPDGSDRFFIVGQDGIIYVLNRGSDGSDAKVFLDISDRHPHFNREDGLLSIAFNPGYKTNGLFYIYYTQENKPDEISKYQNGLPTAFPYRSIVSEWKVSATDPDKADMSSERIMWTIPEPYWNHKGGELCFGPDGYLYLGLGDGGRGDDPFGNGQSTSTWLGKMLRIDVNTRTTIGEGKHVEHLEYGIPSDNPYVKEAYMGGVGPKHEIWAYGFRNPWRYSFDRKTGALWVGDVGQDLWEEVDLVVKGGDYGWSIREGAHHFKPGITNELIDPVMEYPHRTDLLHESLFPDHLTGQAVIGGYVYRGSKYPSLDGIYIYADYSPGNIFGFRYDYDTHKVTSQGLMLKQPQSITSFAEDNDGELYVLMEDGHIYQITAP